MGTFSFATTCAALHINAHLLRALDTQLKDELMHVGSATTDKKRKVG